MVATKTKAPAANKPKPDPARKETEAALKKAVADRRKAALAVFKGLLEANEEALDEKVGELADAHDEVKLQTERLASMTPPPPPAVTEEEKAEAN